MRPLRDGKHNSRVGCLTRFPMPRHKYGVDLPERFKEYKPYYRYMKRCKGFREALMHGGAVVHDYDLNTTMHLRLRKDGKTIYDDAAWYFFEHTHDVLT